MARFLVIFAVLLAATSQCYSQLLNSNQTFKEELTEKLGISEHKLDLAKDDASRHGLHFYIPKFDHQLKAIQRINKTVQALKDDTKWDEEIFNTVVDMEFLVNTTVIDPYPEETLKAKAIYLAAIHTFRNLTFLSVKPEKLISDVLAINDEEDFVSTHPLGWPHEHANHHKDNEELQAMYQSLRESINGIVRIPSFHDHANLLEWSREKERAFGAADRELDVAGLPMEMNYFERWTFHMAKLMPLTRPEAVKEFYETAQKQYKLRLTMLEVPYLNPSFQESFRERLRIVDRDLEEGMLKYAKEGTVHYIRVLNKTRIHVQLIQERVEKFPKDPKEWSKEMISETAKEIFKYESIAKMKIESPAPEEGFKAGAIYLAAMKSVDKKESESSRIIEVVKDIVKYEENTAFVRNTPSFQDKMEQEKEIKNLADKYENLKKFFEGQNIPSSEDDNKLMAKAAGKIQELLELHSNKKPEVEKLQKALGEFEAKTQLLNELLPIDTVTKVDYWLENAKVHLGLAKSLEDLLA